MGRTLWEREVTTSIPSLLLLVLSPHPPTRRGTDRALSQSLPRTEGPTGVQEQSVSGEEGGDTVDSRQ